MKDNKKNGDNTQKEKQNGHKKYLKAVASELEDQTSTTVEEGILEELPPEIQRVVQYGIRMQRISGPAPPPFADKVNEKHIDKILDLAEKDSYLTYKNMNNSKIIASIWLVILLAVFVYLAVFFVQNDKDVLLQDLIKMVVAFIGGFGSGYGVKSYLERK